MKEFRVFNHFRNSLRGKKFSHPQFCLVLICFFILLALSACQKTSISFPAQSKLKKITVVLDDNYPPFTFRDANDNLQGILIDQWHLWEEKTGTTVEITGMDWSLAMQGMEAGEYDVIDTMFYNDARAKIYDFSAPYTAIDVPVYFSNQISGIKDVGSLQGFPVAVKSGDAVIDFLMSNGVSNLQIYSSYEGIIRAAASHKVVVFAIDKPPAQYYLHKYNLQNQFNSTEPLYSGQFHRAVRKGNTEMLAYVENGFALISKSEYAAINRKWYGTPGINEEYYIYGEVLFALGTAVLLSILLWNRLLQRKVNERTKALNESETKFRLIFETAGIGITTADEQGQILSGNPIILHTLGYTSEEYGRLTVGSLTHPLDRQKFESLYNDMWAGKRDTYIMEKRNLHKDGHYIWGRVTGSIVRDFEGHAKFSIGMFEDISEWKTSEKVRESIFKIAQATTTTDTLDELYTAIYEILNDLMPVANFFISIFNPDDGLLHFPFTMDKFDPDDKPIKPGRSLTNYVMRTGKPLLIDKAGLDHLLDTGEVELIGKKPADWLGVPLVINDQSIGAMVAQNYSPESHYTQHDADLLTFVSTQIAQAIERKKTEEALIKSDADMRALFAAMTDIVMVLDSEGRYLKIVGTNTDLLYKPARELIGKTIWEILEKEDAQTFLQHITTTLTSYKKTTFEYSLVIKDKRIWFSASLSPINADTVIWVARDITDRKKVEEALKNNEARYHDLFEESPISLWEEDFSEVKQYLENLKQNGITDIRGYFITHPETIKECISKIKIIDVNKAALKLVHARNKKELIGHIENILDPNTEKDFIQEFVNIADGLREFTWEGFNKTIEGNPVPVTVHWSVSLGYEISLSKVIIAIEDITLRKRSEEKLNYRSRFEDLLTKISTQFINLPSSELDKEINSALMLAGKLENMERGYVFRFDDENKKVIVTNEWCEPGIDPAKAKFHEFSFETKNWLTAQYSDHPLVIRGEHDFPDEAAIEKENFISNGIKSLAVFPMRVNQQVIGYVGFDTLRNKHDWEQDSLLMLQQFANILSNAVERARLISELEFRAIRDELTGVLNRRGFLEFSKQELNRADRFGRPTGILLFDIDYLKQVNDSLGHLAGDQILQEVVKCCFENIRQIDLLGRWGGDEFVILLPETNQEAAAFVAQRLCDDIESRTLLSDSSPTRITISVGVASTDKGIYSIDELFSHADTALYSAKQAGRNCVKSSPVRNIR